MGAIGDRYSTIDPAHGSHHNAVADVDAHRKNCGYANFTIGTNHSAWAKQCQMPDQRSSADGHTIHDDAAVGEHHVGTERGAVGDVCSRTDIEQWQIPNPCIGINGEIETAPITKQAKCQPLQQGHRQHDEVNRRAVIKGGPAEPIKTPAAIVRVSETARIPARLDGRLVRQAEQACDQHKCDGIGRRRNKGP
jgi:hypothetical protein